MRTRKVSKNMICAFCGELEGDSPYVEVEVTVVDKLPVSTQMLGAHAGCMTRAMGDGINIEIVDW